MERLRLPRDSGASLSLGLCEAGAASGGRPGDAKKPPGESLAAVVWLMAAGEVEQDDQRRQQQGEYYNHAPTLRACRRARRGRHTSTRELLAGARSAGVSAHRSA